MLEPPSHRRDRTWNVTLGQQQQIRELCNLRERDRAGSAGRAERLRGNRLALRDQEFVSCNAHRCVMMKAVAVASLEVAAPNLMLSS